MQSLLSVLKALTKSSLTKEWLSGMKSTKQRATCTRASAPPLTPTPSCFGLSMSANFVAVIRQATLATSLLNVSPTAMGLIPPSFLLKASSDAPKRKGQTQVGVFPDKTKLTKFVIASRRDPPICLFVRSFKCWGRRPSGPPEDPAGNELIASSTASDVTVNGEPGSCLSRGRRSAGAGGCLSLIF